MPTTVIEALADCIIAGQNPDYVVARQKATLNYVPDVDVPGMAGVLKSGGDYSVCREEPALQEDGASRCALQGSAASRAATGGGRGCARGARIGTLTSAALAAAGETRPTQKTLRQGAPCELRSGHGWSTRGKGEELAGQDWAFDV